MSALLPSPDIACRAESVIDPNVIDNIEARDALREETTDAANRVVNFTSDYLLRRNDTYSTDTDLILRDCGLHGMGFRKIYNDLSRRAMRTRVERVLIDDVYFSQDCKSMTTGRITHRLRLNSNDMIRNLQNGVFFTEGELSEGQIEDGLVQETMLDTLGINHSGLDENGTHEVYETQAMLVIEEDMRVDGLARPYLVSIHRSSQKILSVRRNWKLEDDDEGAIQRLVLWPYSTGASYVQPKGLGAILGPITRALRTAQRRGFEAAFLQNHPSGLKLSNLKVRDDASHIVPGEFVDVDSPTGRIADAFYTMPFNGPVSWFDPDRPTFGAVGHGAFRHGSARP